MAKTITWKKVQGKIDAKEHGFKWLCVQKLGSGWAAVMFWVNAKDNGPDAFAEPWTTGIGRYPSKREAIAEMEGWAEADEVPYVTEDT